MKKRMLSVVMCFVMLAVLFSSWAVTAYSENAGEAAAVAAAEDASYKEEAGAVDTAEGGAEAVSVEAVEPVAEVAETTVPEQGATEGMDTSSQNAENLPSDENLNEEIPQTEEAVSETESDNVTAADGTNQGVPAEENDAQPEEWAGEENALQPAGEPGTETMEESDANAENSQETAGAEDLEQENPVDDPESADADEPIILSVTEEGSYTVKVSYKSAETGIPADAALKVNELFKDQDAPLYENYESRMAEALETSVDSLGSIRLFDISLVSREDETLEYEPAEGTSVKIEILLHEDKTDGTLNADHTEIVHFADETQNDVLNAEVETKQEGTGYTFESNGFSVYAMATVDFTFNGFTWHINVGDSILLSELFAALGIEENAADAETVKFTNQGLIRITKSENDWQLKSLVAFDTEELLTITMSDGDVYEIQVTDAVTTVSAGEYKINTSNSESGAQVITLEAVAGSSTSFYIKQNNQYLGFKQNAATFNIEWGTKNSSSTKTWSFEKNGSSFKIKSTGSPGKYLENLWKIAFLDMQAGSFYLFESTVKHTVTFNVRGHGTAPEEQTIEDGQKATRPSDPSATGYVFSGWYTDENCTNAFDFDTPIKEPITLYAKWTQGFSVNFNMNGHGTQVAAQGVASGGKATEPTPAPTAEGWLFGGWYTEAACTNSFDFSTPITADRVLYAKWTRDPSKTELTYNANGSGEADVKVYVAVGGSIAAISNPFTYTMHTFSKWNTVADGSGTDYEEGSSVTVPTDMTLYAQWEEVTGVCQITDASGNVLGGPYDTLADGVNALYGTASAAKLEMLVSDYSMTQADADAVNAGNTNSIQKNLTFTTKEGVSRCIIRRGSVTNGSMFNFEDHVSSSNTISFTNVILDGDKNQNVDVSGSIISSKSGNVRIEDAVVRNANGGSNASAIYVFGTNLYVYGDNGETRIENCIGGRGAVEKKASDYVYLKGNVYVYDNYTDSSREQKANINVEDKQDSIKVIGPLTDGAKIGVYGTKDAHLIVNSWSHDGNGYVEDRFGHFPQTYGDEGTNLGLDRLKNDRHENLVGASGVSVYGRTGNVGILGPANPIIWGYGEGEDEHTVYTDYRVSVEALGTYPSREHTYYFSFYRADGSLITTSTLTVNENEQRRDNIVYLPTNTDIYVVQEETTSFTPQSSTCAFDGADWAVEGSGTKIVTTTQQSSGPTGVEIAFTNNYSDMPPHSLGITKTVSGTAGDVTKSFGFTVSGLEANKTYSVKKYTTTDGSTYTEDTSAEADLTADAEGKAEISLKHYEKIEILQINHGSNITVTESDTDAEGYETTITGAGTTSGRSGTLNLSADSTMNFINNAEAIWKLAGTKYGTSSIEGNTLGGAVFRLYDSNDPATVIAEATSAANDNSSLRGILNFDSAELEAGHTYILAEYTAPKGYERTDDFTIEIAADGKSATVKQNNEAVPLSGTECRVEINDTDHTIRLHIVDPAVYHLPEYGGQGGYLIIGLGALLIGGCMITLYRMRRRTF